MLPLWIKSSIIFKNIKIFALDIFFPINCIGCKTEGVWLCEKCIKKIKIREEQFCPLCEKNITPDGRICFTCKGKSPLTAMLVSTSYQDPTISKAVHFFKYRFVENLSQPLSEIILKTMRNCELPLPDLIIPIPLHRRRLRWRGFNQSALLATELAKSILPGIELPMSDNLLIRKRYTPPQMSIKNHSQRHKNVRDAFTISEPAKIKGQRILLVDDITTTGSTIFECARVLKNDGAKEVFATVIARQEYRRKS